MDKLRNLEGAKGKTELTRAELDKLEKKNREVEDQQRVLEKELEAEGKKIQQASLSVDGLRRRGQELSEEILKVRKLAVRKKEFKYHAPVSRVVQGEEMFFECRGGKVAFIDMPAFLHEVKADAEGVVELLRKEYKVTRVTAPVGAFRLQYFFERERGILDSPGNFRYSMSGWVVEPMFANRGEPLRRPCSRLRFSPHRGRHRPQPNGGHFLGLSRQLRALPRVARLPLRTPSRSGRPTVAAGGPDPSVAERQQVAWAIVLAGRSND